MERGWSLEAATNNLYVWDEARGFTPLTFDPGADSSPLWTPDGLAIVFQSRREGGGIYRKAADGTSDTERPLLEESTYLTPSPFAWSPAGDLLFNAVDDDGIGLLRMSGERRAEMLLDEPDAVEERPVLSRTCIERHVTRRVVPETREARPLAPLDRGDSTSPAATAGWDALNCCGPLLEEGDACT
jgi:hypothetical protein